MFTDIEGSTQRWDRDRAAMQDAVRRHDTIVRAAIDRHRGHVFKTIGDAFCTAFARPEDAVAAIVAVQQALGAEDFSAVDGLRVRAAIHVGTADERDGDYFGPTVNRVARLLGIAHGGQVLLSGATADLILGNLPPGTSLHDLGEHRLRDLARPEYVYGLAAPGLETNFPALRSLGLLPNNLPRQMTSLIGRETEIAEITALVETHRFVNLVGSGGIGKTRTTLQVGANLLDGSGDGVWFIELAPLANGDYIPTTIAAAMGLSLESGGDPLRGLVAVLAAKHALLIIDNCEHLVDATARVVDALLRGCPGITIIASSRQALGITGETVYRLPSLDVPASVATISADEALRYPAIALFCERATALGTPFALTDGNAPIVAYICRRLDGIALAIELAAARVKILSPRTIRDGLNERFRLLTAGSRDLMPRHKTLRALVDWSHDLLDDSERALFRRLAIFVNGFTLEGAVAVGGGDDLDEYAIIDVLGSLVEKSLVLTEPHDDAVRYRLLESTRAYASEKLREAGENDVLASRHLRYLRDRFAALRAEVERTARSAPWVDAFLADLEDIRVALDAALTRPDIVAGAELLAAIERVWVAVALRPEGITRIEPFLAVLPERESLLRAKLFAILCALLHDSGFYARCVEAARQAVALARENGDGATLAFALLWFAKAQRACGDADAAERELREAEAIPGLSARLRTNLLDERALASVVRGDLERAARTYAQLRSEQRALGNARNEYIFVQRCAQIAFERMDVASAISLIREMLPAMRAGTDATFFATILADFAAYLTVDGDLAGAIAAARESIVLLAAREPAAHYTAQAIQPLALVCALQGNVSRAAVLAGFGFSAEVRAVTVALTKYLEQTLFDRVMPLLCETLDPDELARLTAEGATLTVEAAAALALAATQPG